MRVGVPILAVWLSILFIMLAASNRKRNVTVWRPSGVSVRPTSFFLTLIERAVHTQRDLPGASCDAASVHFAKTISKTDILHWLHVKWQIQFKLASLTYKVLHTDTLSYLFERLHLYVPFHTLRLSFSLTCTSLALISISVYVRFTLQL